MRRFLLSALSLLLIVTLAACGGGGGGAGDAKNKGPQFGELTVTMEEIAQTDKQWGGSMVITNPTEKNQVIEYSGPWRYTMVVTQGETEILRMGFDPRDANKPEIVNVGKGVAKKHVVVWTYVDQKGNKVPAGTYNVTVELHAATAPMEGQQVKGEVTSGKVLGPFKVTVK